MNLYELSQEFKQLQELDIDTSSQLYIDTLESLTIPLENKAQNIVKLTKSWESNISAIDNEIKRLQERKKVQQNKIDRLRNYLRDNMESCGIDKIECEYFTITLKKAGQPVVIIDDESLIDEAFKKVSVSIDKVALKNALKSGDIVKGAHLEDSKRGLLIK